MSKQTAIITGSSSGFGLLTTLELAKQGFRVIATMRDLEKADVFNTQTKDEKILSNIEVHQLDVSDATSIESLKQKVTTLDRVDVLVNNAGFGMGGFAEKISVDDYRRQFETNVFGVMGVTQAVLPKMREQRAGKIIQVSSISGRTGFPGLSPYVSSKFALEGFSESLRLEMAPFGVQVALVEPGSYKTNVWSSGMEIAGDYDEDSDYHKPLKKILSVLEKSQPNHGDPSEVAKLITQLASQKDMPKLRYPIGKGIKSTLLAKSVLSWKKWEKTMISMLKK